MVLMTDIVLEPDAGLGNRIHFEPRPNAALAARQPAATVTVKLSAGDPWTVKLYPGGTEARATVSGRPGAFLVAGDPVAPLEAAFRKAAAPAPVMSPAPPSPPTVPSAPPKK